MAKGIDIGNGYTKFNGQKFASRIKVGRKNSFGKQRKEVYNIEYEGTGYIVGEGVPFVGDNRYFSKEYEICLLTALALSGGKEDFIEENIVIGLPEGKHKIISERLEQHIKLLGQKQIKVEGKEYTIRIKDVIIFIEGAYPIKTEEEFNIITIDNGAGTICVSQWEDLSIIKSRTYSEAMYAMYAEISDYLNTNKGTDFLPTDIEKILNKKSIFVNQIEIDITDIRPIIASHIKGIASYIKSDFKVKDALKIYLMGGGGADTINYWKNEFKLQLVPNSQFINSEIYQAIAKEEFENEDKE